jgi:hypothetical protein
MQIRHLKTLLSIYKGAKQSHYQNLYFQAMILGPDQNNPRESKIRKLRRTL